MPCDERGQGFVSPVCHGVRGAAYQGLLVRVGKPQAWDLLQGIARVDGSNRGDQPRHEGQLALGRLGNAKLLNQGLEVIAVADRQAGGVDLVQQPDGHREAQLGVDHWRSQASGFPVPPLVHPVREARHSSIAQEGRIVSQRQSGNEPSVVGRVYPGIRDGGQLAQKVSQCSVAVRSNRAISWLWHGDVAADCLRRRGPRSRARGGSPHRNI